jgi:hypothetical protein
VAAVELLTGMVTAAIHASALVDSVSLVPQPVAVGVAGEVVALFGTVCGGGVEE